MSDWFRLCGRDGEAFTLFGGRVEGRQVAPVWHRRPVRDQLWRGPRRDADVVSLIGARGGFILALVDDTPRAQAGRRDHPADADSAREEPGDIARRLSRGAHVAAQAAAERADAARQRREQAWQRGIALRQGARGQDGALTAAERATAAAEAIEQARAHAAESMVRAIEAHRMSALAHERAAGTAESVGDAAGAARHREASAQALAAADRDQRAADEARAREAASQA